jgi:hypothetical protein
MREIFNAAINYYPDLVKILVEIRKTEAEYEKLLRCVSSTLLNMLRLV